MQFLSQSSRIWCSLYTRRLDSANDFRTPVLQFINAAHCKNEQISIQKKTVETVNYAIAAKEYRSIYRLCLRKSFNAPLHCNAIIKVQILTNGHSFEITHFFRRHFHQSASHRKLFLPPRIDGAAHSRRIHSIVAAQMHISTKLCPTHIECDAIVNFADVKYAYFSWNSISPH